MPQPDQPELLLPALLDALLTQVHHQLGDEQDPEAALALLDLARGLLVHDEPLELRLDAVVREGRALAEERPELAVALMEILDLAEDVEGRQRPGCRDPDRPCRACVRHEPCPAGCEMLPDPDEDEHGPF